MQKVQTDIGQLLKGLTPDAFRPVARRAYNYMKTRYDQYVYERPSASYRVKLVRESSLPNFLDMAESLCRDGLIILPRYFSDGKLAEMRAEFERLVESNPYNEEAARTKAVHIATGRLAESRLFSELAFEPNILSLVQYYWGKPVVLNGTGGTRIEPFESEDYGSFQWHHDGKRKQVRVFMLLTDVPPGGQRTDIISGSNRFWHEDLTTSRLRLEDALASGKVLSAVGPAGSVVIFDTNSMHRGNRNAGPRRDAWNYAYRAPNAMTTDLAARPPLHPDVTARLTPEQRFIARLSN